MKEILSYYKVPFEDGKQIIVKDHYKNYQELVEGMIECIPFPNNYDLTIILNEEGKLYGMSPNIISDEYDDVLVGPIVVVGNDGENFRSLTVEEIKMVDKYTKQNDFRLMLNNLEKEEKQYEK